MSTDPREVDVCYACGALPCDQEHKPKPPIQHVDDMNDLVLMGMARDELAAENAALREKLEAAERRRRWTEESRQFWITSYEQAEAALTEARAAQAAAQRRASACWLSGYIEGRTGKTCTPPADLSAALQRVRDEAWEPIETAPYGEVVTVRAGSMTFRAVLCMDASMNDDEEACDQWQADVEGEHPPCWSGGACWESNEDEVVSLQPDAWRALRRAPTEGEG